jgi:excisionase family DNA binding protein
MSDEAARPLLLKIPQACKMLAVSRTTLFGLLKSGEIRGVMIGPQQRRVPVSECEAYVARKMSAETEQVASD